MSKLKYYDGTNWNVVNGQITGDTLPIGAEVDYIGETVPTGWEQVSDYSTSEVNTGKTWIDGKPIYRKVIDLGTLPNASTKTIPTGLTFNSTHCILTKLYGIASYNNGISFPLPFSSNNGVEYNVSLNVDNSNNVAVATAQDRSGMTGYAVLEYIKATD